MDVAELSLLGGHLALDFVNTVEDRDGLEPDDVLRTPEDLQRWAERVGVMAHSDQAPVTSEELSATITFREDLHAVLRALVTECQAPQEALGGVEQTMRDAFSARCLVYGSEGPRWAWPAGCPSKTRYAVAIAAAELLTDHPALARTRLCQAELCGWFYLDHSKNRSRRWCSMKVCGTREKSKRRARKDQTAHPIKAGSQRPPELHAR